MQDFVNMICIVHSMYEIQNLAFTRGSPAKTERINIDTQVWMNKDNGLNSTTHHPQKTKKKLKSFIWPSSFMNDCKMNALKVPG